MWFVCFALLQRCSFSFDGLHGSDGRGLGQVAARACRPRNASKGMQCWPGANACSSYSIEAALRDHAPSSQSGSKES